jgi:DNA-binding NtrC family response regulator
LREILHPYGVIEEASDVENGRMKILSQHFDITIIDIELGESSGVDLIGMIVKKGSHCIVVSSYECEETIEKAYLHGAKHYLSKNRLKEQLPVYVQKFMHSKEDRIERIIKEEFITQDKELILSLKKLLEINWKNQTLFISGPTGTGKSHLGKLIHEMTHPNANLVHLNCSEIAENLLESELFGHEKGAFTGADQRKEGKLKIANGGTLFLDEVATMPLSMQQKLLKALDEKTFYPVGSNTPVKCDFTLITATCENITEKIEKKEGQLTGMKIVMSGFRDKLLEEFITSNGGEISSGVSKNTTILIIKDESIRDTGKASKAKELGVKVHTIDSFNKEYKLSMR